MTALQKLQEKIEQWRVDHEALKDENTQLTTELSNTWDAQNEQLTQIEVLKRELVERDAEIEKIIAKVEALLA